MAAGTLSHINKTNIQFYCNSIQNNRNHLFKEALSHAKNGKVLYIAKEELTELPELSQEITMVSRQSMKMISFLYADTLKSLIESIATLPEWQHTPCAIILENLDDFCQKDKLQNACGVIGLLVDSSHSCSLISGFDCNIVVSINEETGVDYCSLLQELYSTM